MQHLVFIGITGNWIIFTSSKTAIMNTFEEKLVIGFDSLFALTFRRGVQIYVIIILMSYHFVAKIDWHWYYVFDRKIHSYMLVRCVSGQFLCQNKIQFLLTVKMFPSASKAQESINKSCRYCYVLDLNETWSLLAGGLMCRAGCKSLLLLSGCYKTLRCVWDGL